MAENDKSLGGLTMFFQSRKIFTAIIFAMTISAGTARAANDGQEDLDKATEAKLSAATLTDLGEVIRLAESALQKGLDKSNTEFANKLLASTLVQRATAVKSTMFKSSPLDSRWPQFRQFALSDLEKAIKLDSKQPQALILIAQLNLLPEGDAKRAKEAINQAVELAADDPQERADALVLRSGMEEKLEKRLPDLNEAVQLAPNDADTVRSRGLVLADLEKYDEALVDLNKAIELDSENSTTYEMKSILLTRMKKYDEALATLDQALKLVPKSVAPWLQKTRIHSLQKKIDDAIEDLNRAVALDPSNAKVILLRSSLYLEKGDKEKALADAQEAVQLLPKNAVAIRAYAAILAEMSKYDEALDQLEKVRKLDPNDPVTILQIGMVYVIQKRSNKAVEIYSEFLKEHPDDAGITHVQGGSVDTTTPASTTNGLSGILYARANAYLNMGKQAEAVADYEKAYKDMPKDTGLLNNFAWVLATSPDEKLRDGKRAVEMATKASELTEYNQSFILSTLAAAYAETGDFDNAVKWSTKSGEIGAEDHAEDYKKELETYKAHKPYRELLSEKEPEKSENKSVAPEEKPAMPENKPAQPAEKSPTPEEKSAKSKQSAEETLELFNGKNLEGWNLKQPRNLSKWTVGAAQVDPQNPDGLIVSLPADGHGELINLDAKGVDIYTVLKFGDCKIELEFMIPKGSNSGVYVMGEYEIQIIDSFGKKEMTRNDLGAIYNAASPKVNAAKAPGQWQSLAVEFQAPRFENGKKTGNARFEKVTLNGQVIHENLEIKDLTPGGLTGKEVAEGPLMFQGDHGPVAFRNIKITLPAVEKK
jgi:tetratricopeptide (TPR) repeat protein